MKAGAVLTDRIIISLTTLHPAGHSRRGLRCHARDRNAESLIVALGNS
jgi:hypothetical protein